MRWKKGMKSYREGVLKWYLFISILSLGLFLQSDVLAFTLRVVDGSGNPIAVGYRWLLEEDNTNQGAGPGVPVSDSISLSIHKSHAPVLMSGQATGQASIAPPVPVGGFFVSFLP